MPGYSGLSDSPSVFVLCNMRLYVLGVMLFLIMLCFQSSAFCLRDIAIIFMSINFSQSRRFAVLYLTIITKSMHLALRVDIMYLCSSNNISSIDCHVSEIIFGSLLTFSE